MTTCFKLLAALTMLLAWQVSMSLALPESDLNQFDFKQHHQSQLSAATSSSLRAIETTTYDTEGNSPRRFFAGIFWLFLFLARRRYRANYTPIDSELHKRSIHPLWLVNCALLL